MKIIFAMSLFAILPLMAKEDINTLLKDSSRQYSRENYEEAELLTKRLIHLYPNSPEPYSNLALIYAQQGRLEEAEIFFQEAMKTSELYSSIYRNIVSFDKFVYDSNYNFIVGNGKLAKFSGVYLKTLTNKDVVLALSDSTAPPLPKLMLDAWLDAWQQGNVSAYLSYYSKDFMPIGISQQDWKKSRSKHISSSLKIKISYKELKIISVNSQTSIIRFQQKYSSASYRDITNKELILVLERDSWKILKETSYKS